MALGTALKRGKKRQMMILLHLLIIPALLYTSDSAPQKEVKKCFFSEARGSTLEKVPRMKSAQVSTGTCSATLFSIEELMRRSPSRQYYGAFDDVDLMMIRGGLQYRMSPDNANEFKSDVYICEKHANELCYHWNSREYGHIYFHHTSHGNILSCDFPVDPHPTHHHIDGSGRAHYVTREEAKSYLITAGIHLPIGMAICKDHYQHVLNTIAGVKEEKCDPSYSPAADPASVDEDDEHTKTLKAAFFSFCQAADVDRMCPKMSFADYVRDTQTRKVDNLHKLWWTSLTLTAPGSEMEVWSRVCRCGNVRGWDNFGQESADLMLPQISHLWSLADDSRTRDIILSQAAGIYTYAQLLPYFPGLSPYRFTKAERIWATQELPEEVTHTYDRWSDEKTEHWVNYLASPHYYMMMPFGLKHTKLSTGEKIDLPNVIRNFCAADTIRNYRAFMESAGLGHLVYSDSTMIRMLKKTPATTRHSLVCVDSFKAAGYEAFDGIEGLIDRLEALGKMDKKEGQNKWFGFLEIRLYLKHDYSLHIKMDSRVSDHSLLYSLSDPGNPKFQYPQPPPHKQDLQCPRCIHIEKTFRDLSDYLTTLLHTDPSNEGEYKEMLFNLGNYHDAILELKAHELRSVYTNLVKQKMIENLEEGHAFITLDYGQKVLPTKPYEPQADYYAKKGLSWHFGHVVAKISDTLVTHLAVQMIVDDKQDSRSTVTLVTNLLKELHAAGVVAVSLRSDNAPNYHCAPTLGSIPSITKDSKVTIKEWTFSEIQNGKGPSDRGAAGEKFELRQQVNAGKLTIRDQRDIFDGLTKRVRPGVSVYLGEVSDPATEPPPSVITRVTDYSHFQKEGDHHLRVWKYYGIGKGEVFKKLYSNAGVYTADKERGRGGAVADSNTAATEKLAIKNRQPTTFWHYDPSLLDTEEPGDRDQDTAIEVEPEKKGGMKGMAYACECGAVFLKKGNYLNHLDYGTCKIHPQVGTSMDRFVKAYKRTIEETVQAKTLTPLQDSPNAVYDNSVGFLPMGWGLRAPKKHGRYPEKTKKWIQDFAVERKKQGKRVDPEEAYKRMVADKSITLDERMSREQIKRYICRLIITPVQKTVVLRARRSGVEADPANAFEWIVTEVEVGEWEIEGECAQDENAKEDFDLYWDFYSDKENQKGIFV